jgi:hypothetical protein
MMSNINQTRFATNYMHKTYVERLHPYNIIKNKNGIPGISCAHRQLCPRNEYAMSDVPIMHIVRITNNY